ncbi:MAG: lipopolysaccharide biosynthesis protein [Pseudomonadota bacterium]
MTTAINKRIAIGATWMVALRQVDRFIGLISLTILARLLLPEDFGLVVYATSLVAIIEIFFQFGFETVLIRDKDAGRESYDTAWTLKILVGAILCALLMLAAYPAAAYFDEPRVVDILFWVALAPLLRGFENIGVVDFQKNLEFNREFKFKFSVRVISTAWTIILAFALRNHWALVFGMLANSALGTLFSFFMSPYRPSLSLTQHKRIFGFSKWLLVQNILDGFTKKSPVFVIGRFFDAQIVAFYNMSNELSNMATGEIAAPIRRALFPGVMAIADDEQKMVDTIMSTIGVIAFIGLPVAAGIGLTAPVSVPLLLGDNWGDIVPLMQILAVFGASMALYSNSHVIYYAVDKPQITAFVTAMRLVLLLPMLVYATPRHGAIGAAWAWTIANIIVTVTEYFLFYHMVRYRPLQLLGMIWRSIAGVAVMGLVVYRLLLALISMNDRYPLGIELAVLAAAGAVCYTIVTYSLWTITGKQRGAESFVLDFIKQRLGRD